jgi:hypothetical protein
LAGASAAGNAAAKVKGKKFNMITRICHGSRRADKGDDHLNLMH